MGIYDRDYVRTERRGIRGGGGFGPGPGARAPRFSAWSFNTWLIVTNFAVYVAQTLFPRIGNVFLEWGHFSTQRVFMLEVWRLVTFQFLHANLMHVGFNMLGLYFFGSLVEQYLGKKRYAAFYLVCGLCGGVLFMLLNLIGILGLHLPGALTVNAATPLIGASAGVFGVIVACAYISPNAVVQLLFPPIPLKMRTFAYGYVAFVALNLFLIRGANQGGDAAHLGGAIAGYYFIRRPHLLRDFFDVFKNSNLPPNGKKRSASEAEIDAILDKIQREGIHSLTPAEKKILAKNTRDRRR